MSRLAECGNLPAAHGRQPYCPVCARLEQVDGTDEEVQRQYDAIFDRLDPHPPHPNPVPTQEGQAPLWPLTTPSSAPSATSATSDSNWKTAQSTSTGRPGTCAPGNAQERRESRRCPAARSPHAATSATRTSAKRPARKITQPPGRTQKRRATPEGVARLFFASRTHVRPESTGRSPPTCHPTRDPTDVVSLIPPPY